MVEKMKINKTHLSLDLAEDRQIIHRDYLAHCLRWSHVIKCAEVGETILDLGCADGPMAMAFYVNKYKPKRYVGIDIRESILEKARKKLAKATWAEFHAINLLTNFTDVPKDDYSVITSFEMIEHIEGKYVEPLFENIVSIMGPDTTFFLSTPCYDGKNMAANHIKEWYFEELKELVEKHFTIEGVWGTFMSQSDFKKVAGADEMRVFQKLREYYDSNLLSILFAPLYPDAARNAIWRLRRK